ncbi:MAG: VCBS repeat-containing protein, partial [Bacteroidales bacterium]|nr:VCBS repeat-containing protein [Bacteroidales bacterium]
MRKYIYTLILCMTTLGLKARPNEMIHSSENEVVVGSISGAVDIGALGGATYAIPINVPNGIGEMQPSLSIVYNNQSGNGLLGWGWNLGGVSAITRTGQTLYHDHTIKGVDFNDDRFALDGQRLMVANGLSDGANGAEYRTEIDQMAKIVSYSCDTTYGPAYFKVWLSNGNIAYYGSRWDSRIGLQQHNDVCVWLLDSVVDRNGNYMSYKYCRGYANYFLTDIYYTGNNRSDVSPLYRIKLEYEKRPDEETVFIGNNTLHQSMILKRISVINTTSTKNRQLWQYDFAYTGGYGSELYEKLKTITFSAGGEEFKATTIHWGTDYNQFSSVNFNFTGDGQMKSQCVKFSGDFNGDGFTDMITVEKNANGSGKKARVYLNERDASGNVVFTQIKEFTLDENITWIYVADFDGDGMDDFMFANRKRRDNWWQRDIVTLDIYLTRRNGNGGLNFVRHETPHADYRLASSKRDVLILGDFLGEGKTSFILEISRREEKEMETDVSENDNIEVRADRSIYFFYDKTQQQFVEHRVEINGILGADVYFPADYDGDGKTEILYSYPQNGYTSTAIVKLFNSNGQYGFQEHYNGLPNNWRYCYPGDFNGDGHTDALFRFNDYDPDGEWRVFLFKQNGFLWNSYFCWDIGQSTNPVINDNPVNLENLFGSSEYLRVGDFNGDGKADIMYPDLNKKTIVCFGPMRNDSGYPPYTYRQVINASPYFSTTNVCFGNFLGKESLQYLGYLGSNGHNNVIRYVHPISNRYNVESIVDGMSNRVRFEYDYLMPTLTGNHANDFFTLDNGQTDANRNIFSRAMPIKALKKAVTDNPDAGTPSVETRYRYSNVMIHTKGHGILGFSDVTTESYVSNVYKGKSIKRFSTTDLGNKCQSVLKEALAYGPNNNLVQRTECSYAVCQSILNDKLYMLLPTSQTGWHYGLDGSHGFEKQTLTLNEYLSDLNTTDTYKKVVHAKRSYSCINDTPLTGASGVLPSRYKFRTVVESEYADQESSWIVNRPKSVLTTAEGNASEGNEDVKSLTIYEYGDYSHPTLPTNVANYPSGIHPDSPIYVRDRLATRESFTYYANGSVKKKTLSGIDSNTLPVVTTIYGYNYGGQFLENVTNTKGYVTQYQYDTDGYGWLIGETDCNNLQTIYSRSPLGSLQSVVHPDQTQSKTERIWVAFGDAHAPRNAKYKEMSTQMDTNGQAITTTSTYYDAAGRCLRTVTFGLNGEAIYTDTRYNSQGLIEGVSAPYFHDSEDEIKWTAYQYDGYGRTVCTKFADDTYQTIDYNGFIVKTTMYPVSEETTPQTVTKTVNAVGWVTESTDAVQNIVKYTYYADGSLKHAQIGNDENTRVSMEYDNARNRTKLTDPDYGTVVSSYNAYGQMESSVNPRNISTRYQYDELGRVHQRTEQSRGGTPVVTTWNYCDMGNEKGLLQSIDYDDGEQTLIYKYDALKRVESVFEAFGGSSLTTYFTYEPNTGRLHETTYPTGYRLRREYSPTGHLKRLTDDSGTTLWLTREKNAMGQITKYMTGNYVGSTLTYDDDTHRLRGILTQQVAKNQNILQDMSYDYDNFTNLAARKDNMRNLEEHFTYDNLNRLNSIRLNDVVSVMEYDAYGRMLSKQADGQTVFDGAQYGTYDQTGRLKPHAMSGAQMYGSPFPTDQQDITYTLFDKVKTITQNGNGQQMSLSYTYGYDRQRIHMEEKLGNYTLREKRYGDHCEFVTENRYTVSRTFLTGPLGVFAVVEHSGDSDEIHYIYKDHLGSWTTITDASGVVEREQSFDAWGNMRDPETWTGSFDGMRVPMFDRGFTGHEHLYAFGLINMNGRVYDPVMSTFLSPDNYIQAPDYSQSFNRYSYCLNNPLKYTDPSGESIVLAVVVGAFWGSAMSL